MSEVILLKVQAYFNALNSGEVDAPELNYEDFGPLATDVLAKALEPSSDRKFRLRMSNIGRPGCILQSEKYKHEREAEPYSSRFRNAYGDLVELLAVSVMEYAGVNVVDKQRRISREIAGQTIDGTYDIIIAEPTPKMYDIKSSSGYLFNHKYRDRTLNDLWKEGDGFGYVTQIYNYAEARKVPVGGLIVISKETGEWIIVPPPTDDTELKQAALARATDNVRRLISDEPFKKDFTDVPEKFKKKLTGNRVLTSTCAFCSYKKSCWPNVKYLPQVVSTGQSPRWFYYTHLDEKYVDIEPKS